MSPWAYWSWGQQCQGRGCGYTVGLSELRGWPLTLRFPLLNVKRSQLHFRGFYELSLDTHLFYSVLKPCAVLCLTLHVRKLRFKEQCAQGHMSCSNSRMMPHSLQKFSEPHGLSSYHCIEPVSTQVLHLWTGATKHTETFGGRQSTQKREKERVFVCTLCL